jgi:hypothetical protein
MNTKMIPRDSEYAASRLELLANDLNQIIVQRQFIIVVIRLVACVHAAKSC